VAWIDGSSDITHGFNHGLYQIAGFIQHMV